ncbi:hypothetical protein EDM53_04470 [Rickettsiales endosymbiont of Peranema trichophorum]|uniref:division/cell wall cluster transcriptional repressor MraZ n=1 Tax=Rickettsiales endosymbiont of Peranema trichophorum TaxID=2486577 RepID=UPI00102376F9|nr:hypothetical protein [Rickettsiales endosymbiont of Peranema trichophorum]RZI45983.1 hypothetical protein EDM53_04470 [Rickettsiales endosymbiont of Peranema trichophorum]
MDIFVSSYESKLDDKGRLSIPMTFRTLIENSAIPVVYAYQSFIHEAIEVCTGARLLELQGYIENLDIFSSKRDALETAILGGCEKLTIDSKGRVTLSDKLLKYATIKKDATFVGKGRTFEIWSSESFAKHYQESRTYAMEERIVLKPYALKSENAS